MPKFLALALHDVDGIVQKRVADVRRRFAHENARVRLAPHQNGQRPDVIEMRVRNDNGIEFAIGDRFEIRKRLFALQFRMHPAIEHEPLACRLEVVTIGADLGATRQVDEFQNARTIPPRRT